MTRAPYLHKAVALPSLHSHVRQLAASKYDSPWATRYLFLSGMYTPLTVQSSYPGCGWQGEGRGGERRGGEGRGGEGREGEGRGGKGRGGEGGEGRGGEGREGGKGRGGEGREKMYWSTLPRVSLFSYFWQSCSRADLSCPSLALWFHPL